MDKKIEISCWELDSEYEYIHKLSSDDKLKWWGYGEWVEEPDEVRFEWLGFKCRILRICAQEFPNVKIMFGGHLCGYICVPKEHQYYDKDVFGDNLNIQVHGGLTFGKMMENEDYWIGFDCAHSCDIIPSMEKTFNTIPELIEFRKKFPPDLFWAKSYKNIAYCINECKSLAEQLLGVKKE